MAGLRVQAVEHGSELDRLGVRSGDRVLAVDGLVPRDVIDLQFELPEARRVVLERASGERLELRPQTTLDPAALTLVEAVPSGIRECNNHCEFCFIRGLPAGLRPSLYIFDDDYRYSFLWGNFLTLTNLDERDWARIGYQRLSPLNVSVHATEPAVRQKLLNNRHAPPILAQLERLKRLGIQVNAQVVLCAGLNDGAVLDRTIEDLAELHPAVASLSVVPVGLTRYSRVSKTIRRPTPGEASEALEQCERWHAALRPQLGKGFVYASDELYVLAGRDEVPPAAYYDGFPVLTNGVGLLRNMLDEWQHLLARVPAMSPSAQVPATPPIARDPAKLPMAQVPVKSPSARDPAKLPMAQVPVKPPSARDPAKSPSAPVPATPPIARPREVAWITGQLAAPALERMADSWLASQGWRPRVVVVHNAFFGAGSISVSGLLSGADLIQALRALPNDVEDIVLPAGPFGFDGRSTLDGFSPEEVGAAHPGRVHLASTPRELLSILMKRVGRTSR